jgi:hypothetical protein
MPLPIRSHPRLASCVLLAATASALALVAGGTAQAVTAQPASHHAGLSAAPVVNLSMDYTAPFVINPQSAGPVTFSVNSGDGQNHWFAGMRYAPGVTAAQATAEIIASYSTDPSVALPALKEVYRDINYSGGLSVTSAGPSWFSESLSPGSYNMSDTPPGSEDNTSASRYTSMQVADPAHRAAWPHVDAVISVVEHGGQASFVAPSRLPANGTFLAINPRRNAQPYEFLLHQLLPGTTAAQFQAWATAKAQGLSPASPFASPDQQGLMPISPGDAAVFHANYTPGLYVLVSFLRDPNTGVARTYEGTFKLITLY